jgi:hypothetical protein
MVVLWLFMHQPTVLTVSMYVQMHVSCRYPLMLCTDRHNIIDVHTFLQAVCQLKTDLALFRDPLATSPKNVATYSPVVLYLSFAAVTSKPTLWRARLAVFCKHPDLYMHGAFDSSLINIETDY